MTRRYPLEQRKSEHAFFSLLVAGVLLVVLFSTAACGGCTKKIVTPDDPSAAAKMYMDAMAQSDWDTVSYMLDKKTKELFSQYVDSPKELGEAMVAALGSEYETLKEGIA